MTQSTIDHYRNQFAAFERNGARSAPAWVHDLRRKALERFAETGFPTIALEDWKYTNVAPIARTEFHRPASSGDVTNDFLEQHRMPGTAQHLVVFVDGRFSPGLSSVGTLPDGTFVGGLAAALASDDAAVKGALSQVLPYELNPFAALNTAFLYDGLCVRVPAGTAVGTPVHALFVSTSPDAPAVTHLRNLIVADEGASVTVLTSYVSAAEGAHFTNAVTEVLARSGSAVEVVKMQRQNGASYHVENVRAHQYAGSMVHLFSLALGAAIARNDMSVIIDGEAAECNLNGLYIASGEQLLDHHTFMHHIHPNCPSHELFKGILTDSARAVFNGKVYVEPEAQKTDSKQTNRNLLLSDTAIVDTKPELEIFADDVKCTHGAAVGGLNEAHAFYLKSRGIPAEATRTMLTVGFAAEATEKVRHTALRRHVDAAVVEHLKSKLGSTNVPDIVHGT